MRDQHQHHWPDRFSVLVGGRGICVSQFAGGTERHRGAINVEGSQFAKPRRRLLNEGLTNAFGKVFDDLQRQSFSRVTVGSGFFTRKPAIMTAFPGITKSITEHLGAAQFNRPPRTAKRHGFSPPFTGDCGGVDLKTGEPGNRRLCARVVDADV